MDEIEAQVLEVNDILEMHPTAVGLVCDLCAIDYDLEDYQILKDNKKLVYFATHSPNTDEPYLFCHSCFFKYIKKTCGGKRIRVSVITKDGLIQMSFTPHELLPEDYDEDSGDSYLGLF